MSIDILQQVKERANNWLTPNYDIGTQGEVKRMLEKKDSSELIDAFYKDLEFGTGGMRGLMGAGSNRMNIYTVGAATQGFANCLKSAFSDQTIKVVIGHDCRNNSRLFSETAADIFTANGIEVYLFEDLRPTPEVSFAIKELKCQGGIILTASHNPKEYNGYKVYWDDGSQVVAPHDKNIISEVGKVNVEDIKFEGNKELMHSLGDDFDQIFLDRVGEVSLNPEIVKKHKDLKVVYTPIHGTGVKLIPLAIKKFGFDHVYNVPEQDVVDGNFPTVESPNPEEQTAMAMALEKGKEVGAELILASDPDSDRIGVACKNDDGEYILLNGNQTFLLFFYYVITYYKENNLFTGDEYVVKTIVTTELAAHMAKQNNLTYYDCYTGFKNIATVIRQQTLKGKKYIMGGEESFGLLPSTFVMDKDAVTSIAMMCEIAAWAKDRGLSVFELLQQIYVEYGFSQEYMKYVVRQGKEGAEEIVQLMKNYRETPFKVLAGEKVNIVRDFQALEETNMATGEKTLIADKNGEPSNVLQYFTDNYKVSVRPSGTEPKIKFYFEVRFRIQSKNDISKAEKEAMSIIYELENEIKA